MSTPAKVDVGDDTRDILGALAMGDPDLLATGLEVRAEWKARSHLDDRSYALVKLAALIALEHVYFLVLEMFLWTKPAGLKAFGLSPEQAASSRVLAANQGLGNALAEGATPEDIVGVLIAVAPQVGGPRLVSAAPEIMVALGLTLPDGM